MYKKTSKLLFWTVSRGKKTREKVEMELEELLLVTARRDVYVAAARRKHSLAASDVLKRTIKCTVGKTSEKDRPTSVTRRDALRSSGSFQVAPFVAQSSCLSLLNRS